MFYVIFTMINQRVIMFKTITKRFLNINFSSKRYWENRYLSGGNSGDGSYGKYAEFKAKVLNDFVKENQIKEVIEFGCGDGNQLSLAKYPKYTGIDVSGKAIDLCITKHKNDPKKSFLMYDPDYYYLNNKMIQGDLILSLDVIFHLVEDKIFKQYMQDIFESSTKYVIIYSSNFEERKQKAEHVKHREFTQYIKNNIPSFSLIKTIQNQYRNLSADFFIYKKM